jgi:hypothetical protein
VARRIFIPMLFAKPNTKRFLEVTQLVLTFVSVCAVVDASRIHSPPDGRPGYYASIPRPHATSNDRRLADLARVERKRREAEQDASRRRAELGVLVAQRELRA